MISLIGDYDIRAGEFPVVGFGSAILLGTDLSDVPEVFQNGDDPNIIGAFGLLLSDHVPSSF